MKWELLIGRMINVRTREAFRFFFFFLFKQRKTGQVYTRFEIIL